MTVESSDWSRFSSNLSQPSARTGDSQSSFITHTDGSQPPESVRVPSGLSSSAERSFEGTNSHPDTRSKLQWDGCSCSIDLHSLPKGVKLHLNGNGKLGFIEYPTIVWSEEYADSV